MPRTRKVGVISLRRAHAKGVRATACFLEGFLEGSLKEVLPRRRLVRASIETQVLRRVLSTEGVFLKALRRRLEGRSTPFRRVRPPSRAPYCEAETSRFGQFGQVLPTLANFS